MPSVSSIAAQTLQRRILGGEFAFGTLLPSQRSLSDSLGISRASLREAVSMLEALGLVRSQPGKGVFVTFGGKPDPASLPIGPSAMPPQALFEFRLVLEPSVAGLAAQRAGQGGRASLAEIQDQMETALAAGDLVMASEWDLQFHLALFRLSGNAGLAAVASQFHEQIAHSLRLPFANRNDVWAPADEHRAVLAAVLGGDSAGATRSMRDHLIAAAGRVGLVLDDAPAHPTAPDPSALRQADATAMTD